MKIVIAPDSFKESLTAAEVAEAIERGLKQVWPQAECVKVPVADGGEGTMQSLVDATAGRVIHKVVTGPLGEPVKACFGMLGNQTTAVVEMASASGLELVPEHLRDPRQTTSRGTGELILHALDEGIEELIIGLGGSATNDGGVGMMAALGVTFTDRSGSPLAAGGSALAELANIDISGLDQRLQTVRCIAACDVDNPLTGANGASAVFGPQKGADPVTVAELDGALKHYGTLLQQLLGQDISTVPGAGAAGGLGAALLAFVNARLQPGIDIVMEAVALERQLQGADLVITGEGRIDGQSAQGKTPVGVARLAKKQGIPVVALAGCVGAGAEAVYQQGIDAFFPVVHGAVSLQQAFVQAPENLQRAARNLAAVISQKII